MDVSWYSVSVISGRGFCSLLKSLGTFRSSANAFMFEELSFVVYIFSQI
jgi:hypothetical protein